MTSGGLETVRDGLDAARARLFGLLGRLLAAPPDAALLARLRDLRDDGTLVGTALAELGQAAAAATPAALLRAYHDLFIGLGRGEVLPYASFYRTGFLHERPLAELRTDLARLGIERAEGVAEPEDHAAFLFETVTGLLDGTFEGGPDAARDMLDRHLRPWAGRLFADLEAAEAAREPAGFYRAVGRLGRTAMDIERAVAELAA